MKKIIFILSFFVSISLLAQELDERQQILDLIAARERNIKHFTLYPQQLADAARSLDRYVIYDPSYVKIDYPNGDVAPNRGVCSDVVIRAFRKAWGWDLQKTIYEFQKEQYPDRKLDRNIDHRRVRNLMEFFDIYFDMAQLYNMHENEYRKGNIIIWDLGGGQLHIGICVGNDSVMHNICCGQVIEPMFMRESVIRNYSFEPDFHREVLQNYKKTLKEYDDQHKQ